ncbi:MAG: phosphodiester glycosidase family protein [Bacteroidales bacterium]|nr:phosphodiester glycosidase family protein [Bacteroidales bacterium]
MNRIILIIFCLLSFVGARAGEPPIGKSIGRWTGFGLESMKENKAGGLDYIEVTMNNVIGKDTAGVRDRAAALKADIDASGLKVWSVHMPYSRKLDISVLDDSKRAENVQYMKDMMRVAGVFQPQYLVLHPSSEPITPVEREQRLANSHASIGELAPVAKEIGAVLCVENLPRTCLGQNGEEMMKLIEGYDEVGLCFDTNHLLYQSHEDYLKAVAKGKIRTVHLSDYDFADERHLIPGKGLINNKALWAGIKENGYDGIMMFECYGEPAQLDTARLILLGELPQPDNSGKDSLEFVNASWEITDLGKGAQAMYAQIPMFYSTQSICVVKYPMKKFSTDILHRPGETAGKPSEIGKEIGAAFALNGGYFHVKQRIPSVYFREENDRLGYTHPTELYRVDGLMGLKDRKGRKAVIDTASDTTQYDAVSEGWDQAMASGPLLVVDGSIAVPLLTGDKVDGANIEAMLQEQKQGSKIRTHYSSAQFYDKRHPRAAFGTDDEGNAYLLVIDGRFKGKADGATIYETAYICHMLGMTNAINLDGGGSTTLWTEKTGVINHPYDNKKFDHEGERSVPNLIVVY